MRRQLAEAYWRLGEINGELGNRPEAIAALEQAVGIFEPLRAAAPADVELSIASARALQSLGYFRLRNDEADPGERAVRSAIELLEPLERDHPEIAEYGRRLGRCYDLLGVVGIVPAGARSTCRTGIRRSSCSRGPSLAIRKISKPERS